MCNSENPQGVSESMPINSNGAVSSLATSIGEIPPDAIVFGHSEVMQALRQRMDKVASANVPVLIQGESGTGKDIIARMVHGLSPWRTGPYVKVNCPAIPGTLLESELFGYEKGAFTGAYGSKPGRVEMAHRGTLFLDEISELDLALQSKLLQLLQDGQFCRIGAQEDKKVEVRVVCATNRRLEEEIETGTFRQDLFYRINVVNLHLVPLRERTGDIPALVSYFMETFNDEFNCRAKPVSSQLMNALQVYHWPGNLRQLENLIKRYVILGNEAAIASELEDKKTSAHRFGHIPHIPAGGSISLKAATKEMVRDFEQQVIVKALEAHSWNGVQTARALKISYRAFLYKVKEVRLATSKSPVNTINESVGI